MAIIQCKECGNDISTKAKSCPKCGAVRRQKNNGCLVVIFALILLVLWGMLVSRTDSPSIAQTDSPEHTKVPSLEDQWHYQQSKDDLSGKDSLEAVRFSSNKHDFKFPYSGPQNAALIIRHHPRFGKDVMLKIERGQILCRSYESCTVQVKFDDGKVEQFSAIGPSDGSSEYVFFENYRRMMDGITAAKTVKVSAEIYQEGNPTWEFDVSNLDKSKL